jgi:hypothetical protein
VGALGVAYFLVLSWTTYKTMYAVIRCTLYVCGSLSTHLPAVPACILHCPRVCLHGVLMLLRYSWTMAAGSTKSGSTYLPLYSVEKCWIGCRLVVARRSSSCHGCTTTSQCYIGIRNIHIIFVLANLPEGFVGVRLTHNNNRLRSQSLENTPYSARNLFKRNSSASAQFTSREGELTST